MPQLADIRRQMLSAQELRAEALREVARAALRAGAAEAVARLEGAERELALLQKLESQIIEHGRPITR